MKEVADADISRKGHLSREKSRVAMVQRNRWHFLFTMARNGATLYQLRVQSENNAKIYTAEQE